MKYKALRNITSGDLIATGTEDLTAEQLGGQESVERLERLGAIEKMGAKKAEPEDAGNAVKTEAIPAKKEK